MTRTSTTFALFIALATSLAGCTVITGAVTEDAVRCGSRNDGTVCGNELDDDVERVCVAGQCVERGCGDGYADPVARLSDAGVAEAEECDDGNDVSGDGCEPTICRFSCTEVADCDDALVCNGAETCDLTTHACVGGTPVACGSPSDACHAIACDDDLGGTCVEALIDADGDGHAPSSLGACGDDCDDAQPEAYTGHEGVCGDGIDNNCSGSQSDELSTTWYVDCDGDSYAASTAGSVPDCYKPANPPGGCTAPYVGTAGWTSRMPSDVTTTDCADRVSTANPSITTWHTDTIPGIGGYNWNCSNPSVSSGLEYQYASGTYTCKSSCGLYYCFCPKNTCCYSSTSYSGWVDGTRPSCGVAETMERCGTDISSGGYCGNDVSVTQGCH